MVPPGPVRVAQSVPSLEDVFLRLTTHDAAAEAEAPVAEVANA